MGHVPAHRWADAAAGTVDARRRAAMERHADACADCARARARVRGAREAFGEIRAESAPALNWEHIGARIYWVTSSERRTGSRPSMPAVGRGWRRWHLAAAGATLAAAAAVFFYLRGGEGVGQRPVAAEAPAIQPDGELLPVELVDAPAVPLTGIVTFAQGAIELDGDRVSATEALARQLARGDELRTGADGRLTVQLGARTGFTLGPSSTLALRSLDDRDVELAIDGEVTVEVTHRAPEQRFAIVAGDHRVTVRGTVFRVAHRGGELEVACSRGRVEVESGGATVAVDAGTMLRLIGGERLAARRPAPLAEAARAVLEREVSVRLLPSFPGPQAAFETSSVLRLAGAGDQLVEVDGEPLGTGDFVVRLMPGRHLVDTDGDGAWVRLDAGDAGEHRVTPATAQPVADAADARAQAERARRADLDKVLAKGARVRPCLRPLEKQGLLQGAFVVLDIGVNPSGTLSHLNVVDGNVSSNMAGCIQSVVDAMTLPRGSRARVRYRIAF